VAVVVAAVVLVVAASCSPSIRPAGPERPPAGGARPGTTLPELAVASGTPAAPPPTAASTTTTGPVAGTPPGQAGAGTPLNVTGALLRPPAATAFRPAPTIGCADLADPGWTVTACGNAAGAVLTLTWLVETASSGPAVGHRVTVWRPATNGQEEAVLVAADDTGTAWSDVRAAVAPVSTAGGQQLLVGFHDRVSGVLEVDLVDSPGRVVVHQVEPAGSAVASPGQLDLWGAASGGTFVHSVVRNSDGVWRLVLATRTPGPAPASQV
jgi:hypothetical protein